MFELGSGHIYLISDGISMMMHRIYLIFLYLCLDCPMLVARALAVDQSNGPLCWFICSKLFLNLISGCKKATPWIIIVHSHNVEDDWLLRANAEPSSSSVAHCACTVIRQLANTFSKLKIYLSIMIQRTRAWVHTLCAMIQAPFAECEESTNERKRRKKMRKNIIIDRKVCDVKSLG